MRETSGDGRHFVFFSRSMRIGFSTVSFFLLLVTGIAVALPQAPPEAAVKVFRDATLAMREGHLDEAADGFLAATQSAPTFAEAHFNLALVREEQGRFEDATASFQKALTLKPRLHGANLF